MSGQRQATMLRLSMMAGMCGKMDDTLKQLETAKAIEGRGTVVERNGQPTSSAKAGKIITDPVELATEFTRLTSNQSR